MYIVKLKSGDSIKINKSQAVYLGNKIEEIKSENHRRSLSDYHMPTQPENIFTYKKGNSILMIDLTEISFVYSPKEQ